MIEPKNSQNINLELLRDTTIKRLEYNYAHGFMTLEEFEKRLEKAIHSPDADIIVNLCSDLKNNPDNASEPEKSFLNSGTIPEEETFVGILSGINRKGKWKPARKNKVLVILGGIDLDFSEAELAPGVTDFEFFCAMGGLDLIVPPGINVEVSGIPIMGGIENKLPGDHYAGQPTIRLHGIILMGGVNIKPPKKRKKKKKS